VNEFTSIAGHFDGHGSAPVRYNAHHPMQQDQGFTGSHWTLPSGNHLNGDATCTHFVGRFDGHCDAAVLYRAHRPMEEVRGFH